MRHHLTTFIDEFTLSFQSPPVSHGPENTRAVMQGRRPSSQLTSAHPILKGIVLDSKDHSRPLFSTACLETSHFLHLSLAG